MTQGQRYRVWALIILMFILLLVRCSPVIRLSKEPFRPRFYKSVHTQKFYTSKDGSEGIAMFTDTITVYASISLWWISYNGVATSYPIIYVNPDYRIFKGEWGKIVLNERNHFIIVELKSKGTYNVDLFIEQIF